jgi:glutathione S-transferase
MAIKLHRCKIMWVKGRHPCWHVQKALDESGVEYELVKHPALRWNRKDFTERSGQKVLPAIEFEDGQIVREDSGPLADRIRAGKLDELRPSAPAGQ